MDSKLTHRFIALYNKNKSRLLQKPKKKGLWDTMKAVLVDKSFFFHDMKYERETLAAHGIEFVTTQVHNDEEYIAACEDADVVLICYADTNRNVISHLKNCKALIRYGVGYEVIDVEAATEYGIAACNIPHYCTEEVAVHNMAHILNALRQITADDRVVKSGKWKFSPAYEYRRLSQLTLGIICFGKISRLLATYMKPLGCNIMAFDPYLDDSVFEQYGVVRATKQEICQQCDIITVQGPLNKETYHTLDKKEFNMMKKGVIIVNTARGGLINSEALCDALDAGIVKAASLDVCEGEPIEDANNRINQYKQVTVTPHRGAQSREAGVDLIIQVIQTAIVACEGTIPENAVNRKELLAKQ